MVGVNLSGCINSLQLLEFCLMKVILSLFTWMLLLLKELCDALIKERPDDPVTFLKNELLNNHVNVKIVPRKIIFIAPTHMALEQLANRLAAATDIIVIPLSEIVSEYAVQENDVEPLYNPEDLARVTSKHISKKCQTKGWVLVGFPRTRAEAKALQKCGVLPTHTLEFVHDPKDYTVDDLWNKTLTNWSYEKFRSMMIDYRQRAKDLKAVYKNSLKTIIIQGRPLDKIINDCKIKLSKLPITRLSMLFRILLIGTRGSKRRTIASMLSKRFKLVHVHFWSLLQSVSTMDNSVAEKIILTAGKIDIDLVLNILEDRLLESDCMKYGWVLTGFPNDETDFKALDNIQTPPNRIIFLQADKKASMKQSLLDCGINKHSGEITSKNNSAEKSRIYNQLLTHPNDCYAEIAMEQVLSGEIQYMLDYSEHRSEIVDSTGPINEVFERVENVVINRQAAKKKPVSEDSESLYN
ncbi:adenylate kinase 8-like isoform X2 [Lycorma delicatula]|uniref:adenylate kinase 8-like isoform X2 n=1 Tax=Lycorma delicatula TaxID=130591 RepID=UPI003F517749